MSRCDVEQHLSPASSKNTISSGFQMKNQQAEVIAA
jgi:hypothetical protein